ncbi:uncharacterized protein LOC106473976 isoform X2 [Limulus polyphemus]|uniref:Uncharacterized protein LOC106473976 isoform X2 n=1 Tax=Limulus polyphemus TaxID=6850 RepID=A0ABM1TQA5_LIMPO|nr:uncharacterized protein LOC106473976 isoform X2 [Limulus polyphemus]
MEIETSCGFSDNASSPSKEPKEQYTLEEYQLPIFRCASPQLPGISKTKTQDFESSGRKSPTESYSGPRESTSVSSVSRRSSGIQRQASLCISDDEEAETIFQRQLTGSDHSVLCESLPSNEISESNGLKTHFPDEILAGTSLTNVTVVVHHREGQHVRVASESSPGGVSLTKKEQESLQCDHSHSSLESSSTRTITAPEPMGKSVDAKEASSQTFLTNIHAVNIEEYLRIAESCQQTVVTTDIEKDNNTPELYQQPIVYDVELEETGPSYLQVCKEPNHRKGSVSSLEVVQDGEGWKEVPKPLREACSTELGILEQKLELYQEENRKAFLIHSDISTPEQESSEIYKIRYNDTGSKEDVREETIVISSPDSNEVKEEELVEEEYELERQQYRELWELRATFEEEEELHDILQISGDDDLKDICCLDEYDKEEKLLKCSKVYSEDEENCTFLSQKEETLPEKQEEESFHFREKVELQEKNRCTTESENRFSQENHENYEKYKTDLGEEQSPDTTEKSPDLDQAITQAISFESNADFVLTDESCGTVLEDHIRITNNLLQPPSYESRRHSYKNLFTRRLQRRYASEPTQPATTSTDNSLDSMETEGSSTDASRVEGHTTSLDSTTTDNTDSTGDGQSHMLQQMKADSGYKSMSVDGNGKPPKLSRKQIQPAIDEDTITVLCSVHDEGALGVIKTPAEPLETTSDEQVKRKLVPSIEHMFAFHKDSATWVQTDRKKTKSAFKKRRQYLKSRHDPETLSDGALQWRSESLSDSQSVSGSRQDVREKSSVFRRFFRSNRLHFDRFLMRDYSVDEKSDALFREFARSDPVYEADFHVSSRFLHGHFRIHHHYSRSRDQSNTSPRMSRKILSPQLSIEEEPFESDEERYSVEDDCHSRHKSFSRHQPQVAHAAGIPIIRLPMENNY